MTKAEAAAFEKLSDSLLDLTKAVNRGVNNLEMISTILLIREVLEDLPTGFPADYDWNNRFEEFVTLSMEMRDKMRDVRLDDRKNRDKPRW